LECLISSYSLSVLYLDGVKYGDTQMTAMGILGSISFMSVSRSKPLDKLSPVRPLTSIFHPAKFFSLLGQFVIHLGVMLFGVHSAKKHLPADYEPDLDGTFQPGILNTCVFLVSSVQQVTVFVVNLQGRPFMTGLSENRPLLWSLLGTFILTFMFASETVPGLNRYFQLVPFPDEKFRDFLLLLLVMDLVATMAFDRLMQFFFCREILAASVKDMSWKDVFGILRTFVVIAVLMSVFIGNEEAWDQLLEMQNNLTNSTLEDESVSVAADCVGDLCSAVNETLSTVLDEF
jgi:manganese-transporting P-type ATPase